MKLSVVKGVVFGTMFLIALITFGILTNRGNMDMTAKMEDATLPLVYLDVDGKEVNCLMGYKDAMQTAYVQECITPLLQDRTLNLSVEEYGVGTKRIEYELRSIDGQRLIENNEVTDYERKENVISANLKFKDLLEKNVEYMLVLVLTTEDNETLQYYSKIIICDDLYIADTIDFVMDFHNKTFDKDIVISVFHLESSTKGDCFGLNVKVKLQNKDQL